MHQSASVNSSTATFLRGIVTALFALGTWAIGGCASQQKVDRVHSSLYYQQASIQQLQHDVAAIEQQRQGIISSLDQLRQESAEHNGLIQQNQGQLQQLDGAQQQLSRKLGAMRNRMAADRHALASMTSVEQQRRAIIRAQQQKWREITERTDRQLADIDQVRASPSLESTESPLEHGSP